MMKKKVKSGLKRYYIPWKNKDGTEEVITVRALTRSVQADIMARTNILELTEAVNYYDGLLQPGVRDKLSVEDKGWYEHLLFKKTAELKIADSLVGEEIVRCTVMKPVEWLNSLTPEEFQYLYYAVISEIHHMPINHIYMEMFQEVINFVQSHKDDKQFSKQEMIRYLNTLKSAYESGEQKKNKSNTV